ncbi:MAG: hypothetical protein NVV62_10585 [Terricaulis sp.]|nr:hypothetical protein [Terricaulis sp.]
MTIAWSDLLRGPYVSAITIAVDDSVVATIQSPAQPGQAILTGFNFNHPLLQRFRNADEPLDPDEGEWPNPLAEEILELSRQMSRDRGVPLGDYRIGVETVLGALPDLNRTLDSDLRDPGVMKAGLEERTPRVRGLSALLDEIVVGPLRLARDCINAMTYVGPLREIPTRQYRPQISPDESRWAQGLAAWDLLHTDASGDLLAEVNAWLGGEGRLKTGYRLEKFEFKEIPIPGRFHQLFDRGLTEDDLGELQELYATLGGRSEIALRDFERGIIVAPGDVGVGISQMIPVIVGCLRSQIGVFAVEQPELHVHPAIQVGLGDLFIHAAHAADGASSRERRFSWRRIASTSCSDCCGGYGKQLRANCRLASLAFRRTISQLSMLRAARVACTSSRSESMPRENSLIGGRKASSRSGPRSFSNALRVRG